MFFKCPSKRLTSLVSDPATFRVQRKNVVFAGLGVAVAGMLARSSTPETQNSLLGFVALACYSGISFVAMGAVLGEVEITRHIGTILKSRLNLVQNWEHDALRSSIEVCIWLSVLSWTSEATQSRTLALLVGAFSALVVVMCGESTTGVTRSMQRWIRRYFGETEEESVSLASSSVVVIFLYIYAAMAFILPNVSGDVVIGCVLACLSGFATLMCGTIIQACPPTRRLGISLQDRFLKAEENWRRYPMRSAAELSIFSAVSFGTYSASADCMMALRASTLCGILVSLVGDGLTQLSSVPHSQGKKDGCLAISRDEDEEVLLVPTAAIVFCIVVTCHWVFVDVPELSLTMQLTVACVGASLYLLLGRLFMQAEMTKKYGEIVQHRMLNSVYNWEHHPIRSSIELVITNVSGWLSWHAVGDMMSALGVALLVGFVVILMNDCVLQVSYDVPQVMMETANEAETGRKASETRAARGKRGLISVTELAQHDKPDDLWLLIDGKVYDATSFAPRHPGGSIINKFAGADATDQFAAFHRPKITKYLKTYYIGDLEPLSGKGEAEVDPATADYRKLRQRLWAEGYFEADSAFYAKKHAVWAALILASVLVVLFAQNYYFRTIVGGVLLGLGWQQAAFIAHDASHNGVVEPNGKLNWLAWWMGSVVFGISTRMWTEEHSVHHAITIRPREDPQFNYLPIWLISEKELTNTKVDGEKGYQLNPFIRALLRVQCFTFLPVIVIVGRINFHLISIVFALKHLRSHFRHSIIDLAGMTLYWAWHLLLLSHLPTQTWAETITFCVASHLTAAILHVQLLLSHLNVETFDQEEERAEGFFKFQCKTSRNIAVAWYEHWFHGGLEYQIEHHLFPQLPRHALSQVAPMVKALCERHGVVYRSEHFVPVLWGVLCNMRELAHAVLTLDQ